MIPPFLYFSMTFVSNTITQRPQVSERLYTGQKEVSAASDGGESRQADDLFPNGPPWDGHVKSAVLCTENRIALVSQFVKVWVVRPHIHRKFKLADEARTANERCDTSLYAVVGDTFRQRRTISPPSPDHLPPVHVRCGIARVHAPDVCPRSGRHSREGLSCRNQNRCCPEAQRPDLPRPYPAPG